MTFRSTMLFTISFSVEIETARPSQESLSLWRWRGEREAEGMKRHFIVGGTSHDFGETGVVFSGLNTRYGEASVEIFDLGG